MTENSLSYIDFDLMKKMCHPIAMALFDSSKEPMTAFDDHERDLLESALANPKHTFGGKELYPSLTSKAAILYYSLIKNHPFKNGNKRTATATLLTFLFINDFWLSKESNEKNIVEYLVTLAERVASSVGSTDKEEFLEEIDKWLEKHMVSNFFKLE